MTQLQVEKSRARLSPENKKHKMIRNCPRVLGKTEGQQGDGVVRLIFRQALGALQAWHGMLHGVDDTLKSPLEKVHPLRGATIIASYCCCTAMRTCTTLISA